MRFLSSPLLAVVPMALLAAGLEAQEGSFAPAGTAWPEAPPLAVDEPGGRLEARGAELLRHRGGTVAPVRCTLDGGPGEIRALAASRSGATFVAAARGLFVTGPEVETLDPLDLRDGVPAGEPVGIHLDPDHRLWVATVSAFGCIDARFFFGRTWTAADGLPPGPYLGLRALPDGGLLLRTTAGVHAFRPGRGAAPSLAVVRVAGREHRADLVHELQGPIRLELSATGDGVLTFRHRRKNHHVWRTLDAAAPEIPAPEPGSAAFQIVALDRELRCSTPVTVRIRTPYPPHFSRAFLLSAAGGAAAALLLLFLWPSRGKGRSALLRAALSAMVTLVVGLQLLAGIVGHGRSWPFVGFWMYSERYREGSLLYKPALLGIRADGSVREIHPSSAGTATDGMWQLLVPLVHGGAGERERYLRAYNVRHPHDPLRGFHVQERRWRLTRHGPMRVAPIVLATHEAERDGPR